ncbi:FAD-dependent monooxygenase [Alloalcanivorax mobilis]|uniref:FAD-dependent monooxygenase n=1 Tax=Alloalcanivorax mobilis TaxID=2019569 RepID=UPI000C786BAE|nr:FAD-dependent monooxygenase [Alloalcanivorax mobilis]
MMTGSRQPKVLIIGAGPTGLVLGINLLRSGVSCRLIEQRAEPQPWSRGLSLHARSLEILDAMNLLEPVRRESIAYHAIDIHGDGVRGDKPPLLSLDLSELNTPFPELLCCPQNRLEAVLEERFRLLGGDIWRGAELLDFEQDGAGVRARVRREDGEVTVSALLMVGADGAHSRVRELLGLPFTGHGDDARERFVLADLDWQTDLPRDRFHGFLLAGGTLMALPLPQGWRLIATLDDLTEDEDEDEDAAAAGGETGGADVPDMTLLHERLNEAFGEPQTLSEPHWISHFAIQRRLVSHYRRNRILLAGDACHVQSPIGAQGMNTGIADAFNLAWKLVLFCRGRGGGALLDSYHQERRPVAEEMLRGVDALSRASLVRARVLRGARDSLLRFAGNRPQLGRRILRRASQLDVDYRQSPLVDAGPDAALGWRRQGPLPGDRMPDATLLSQRDGGERRVHALLKQPVHHLLVQLGEETDHRSRVILHALLSRLPDEYLDELRITVIGRQAFETDAVDRIGARVHLWYDENDQFEQTYGDGGRLWLMRPDGYLGYRAPLTDADYLLTYLERLFRSDAPGR